MAGNGLPQRERYDIWSAQSLAVDVAVEATRYDSSCRLDRIHIAEPPPAWPGFSADRFPARWRGLVRVPASPERRAGRNYRHRRGWCRTDTACVAHSGF